MTEMEIKYTSESGTDSYSHQGTEIPNTQGNSGGGELPNMDDFIQNNTNFNLSDIKVGDKFVGSVTTTIDGKRSKPTGAFEVMAISDDKRRITVKELTTGNEYKTGKSGITIRKPNQLKKDLIEKKKENDKKQALEEKKQELMEMLKRDAEVPKIDFSKLEPEDKLEMTINAGITNIWMVGPAGCGKSTISRNVAVKKDLPYLCISCGIGTSATEFVGYKYPNREGTKFAEYYAKPSIILIDEFTALDPSVAQVANAALANGEIETTTGLVKRHPDCIIIATSNTFGQGADRQYVANNQLDASTIDRFTGGIIEVDYSAKYEEQYDFEVLHYIRELRRIVKEYEFRRVVSTRMLQAGCRLKQAGFSDWAQRLIINWTVNEQRVVRETIRPLTMTIEIMGKPVVVDVNKLLENKGDFIISRENGLEEKRGNWDSFINKNAA